MLFSEIKPFVRYAQKFTLGEDASYVSVCPCDNRLFFCEDGATDIETEKAVYRLAKGDVIILPAGSMYKIISPKDKATLVGVNFDYTFARADIRYPVSPIPVLNFCLSDVIERVTFSDVVELNDVLYLQKTHFIARLLERLLTAQMKKIIFYEVETSAYLSSVLLECVRFCKWTAWGKQNSYLNGIFDYVREHCAERLTNEDIAKQFGYNTNYVSDLFKTATGLPLHKYVTGVRIERAIALLETGEKSVGEIAELCGFYDIYHFSKAFKAATGVAPSAYKLK